MHGYVKVVATSDLHFGNVRVAPETLYSKLRYYLYPDLKDCHLLIIAGDIYDQLLTVGSKAHSYACRFISEVFRISHDTGMQVRILHGTYSHDRDQLSVFSALALPKTRYKIVNNIECEEITDLRFNTDTVYMTLKVGYLPDNLSYKRSEDAIEHLKRSMSCLGWNTLDMIVGHGTFSHVVKPDSGHNPPCLYEIEQFRPWVTGPIIMGHIHTPSKNSGVYYCGSFERLAHGEEEDKGFYVLTCDQKKQEGWRSKFIVDKTATKFVTIVPSSDDIPAIMQEFVDKIEENFPDRNGFVRVVHKSPEVRSLLHKICVQQFPNISYSSKSTGEVEVHQIRMDEITLDLLDDVKPNIHNLGELSYQFLEENGMLGDVTKEEILSRMDKIIKQMTE